MFSLQYQVARANLLSIAVAAALLAATLPGQAATLAQYQFTSSSAASSDTDVNSVASLFVDGDGTLNFDATSDNPEPSPFKSYAELPAALELSGTSYFSFTIAPTAGSSLDLTALILNAQKDKLLGGGNKPDVTIDVRSNAGGDDFLTSLAQFILNENSGAFKVDFTALVSGQRFQDVLAAIEFRLYLFDDANGTADKDGGAHLDNVRLTGTASPVQDALVVPEPGSFSLASLLGLGSVCLLCQQRRRRTVV